MEHNLLPTWLKNLSKSHLDAVSAITWWRTRSNAANAKIWIATNASQGGGRRMDNLKSTTTTRNAQTAQKRKVFKRSTELSKHYYWSNSLHARSAKKTSSTLISKIICSTSVPIIFSCQVVNCVTSSTLRVRNSLQCTGAMNASVSS